MEIDITSSDTTDESTSEEETSETSITSKDEGSETSLFSLGEKSGFEVRSEVVHRPATPVHGLSLPPKKRRIKNKFVLFFLRVI